MNEDRVRRWCRDLEEQLKGTELRMAISENGYIKPELWIGWATSCDNLLTLVYGSRSRYCTKFREACEECEAEPTTRSVLAMHALFRSAKNDYIKGYVDIDLKITGDVLGNFVALAKEALNAEHVEVASVLASASLEDALKRYASANGIDTEDSTMTEVINALKAKGLIPRGTSRALQPMPAIRNLALHANWENLSVVEIGSLIGFVETFLLKNFQADER